MTPELRAAAATKHGGYKHKPRRPHKKAKTGCDDCRRRRVKCSEEKPHCRACLRRGVECQYPPQITSLFSGPSPSAQDDDASPNSVATQSPSQHQHQQTPPFSSLSPITCTAIFRSTSREQPSATFSVQDMALLHHWTISASLDIYKNSGLSVICQVTFPKIAFKHPFVMQALLGLTALHIAYLDPQKRIKHIADAAHYHNQGLEGFSNAMHSINDEIADALFVWSSLNLCYVFGISGRLGEGLGDESSSGTHKDRMLGVEWIPMVRGVQAIVMPTLPAVRSGQLSELLFIGNFMEIDPDRVIEPEDQRFCQTRSAWENSPDAQTYEKTLRVLRRCRMFMAQFATMDVETPQESGFNRSWQGAFLFVPFAPEEYFTLLHQRQPPALVLYAFYGALLHSNNDSWFLEGWGYDIVEVVDDLLGSYWRSWIRWPLEVVGLDR